ncbi:UPF0235 protein C15orf40 homolog isoform X4 [Arvicanthis niloticus]|uniref:UPF0235 protein C15orf40 homolog isoform X4 n=1 Tax=Arvicanthis niloticus TaxID=61156 RepID=UPI00402B1083
MLLLAAGRCAWPLLDSCVVPQCLRKPVLQARPVGKNQAKEPETPPPPAGPVATDPKGFVTIAIHAKPGSKQNAVTDLSTEAVGVAIAAPPSEGEANAELCRYLSKVLDLRKSDVVLDKREMHQRTYGGILAAACSFHRLTSWQNLAVSSGSSHHY